MQKELDIPAIECSFSIEDRMIHYTIEAVESKMSSIGCFISDNGLPQLIHRDSVLGQYILLRVQEQKRAFAPVKKARV